MSNVIELSNGKMIHRLDEDYTCYLDRTTILYGGSSSGKSVYIKHIMHILRDHIDQAIIVSPSEVANSTFEDYVDPALIHHALYLDNPHQPFKKNAEKLGAVHFLETIWKRQEMLSNIASQTTKPEVLKKICKHLPTQAQSLLLQVRKKLKSGYKDYIRKLEKKLSPEAFLSEMKKVEKNREKNLIKLYKNFINKFKSHLLQKELSPEQKTVVNFLNVNPCILVVLDDCAASINNIKNEAIFRKFFYQNRHVHITLLISAQDDTDMPANIRKNAFVTIYTDPTVAQNNMSRESNKYLKTMLPNLHEILGKIFSQGYKKFAYLRDDPKKVHFYWTEARVTRPFLFGSKTLHKLCKKLRGTGNNIDTSNEFYKIMY